MPDKTIKHFVMVQFFHWQNPNYPHDIFDVDFLSSQVPLAQNLLRSLENQTNKNFEIIFRPNRKHLADAKYEPVFAALRNSTTLPIKFLASKERLTLIKKASKNYDYVITSQMDFDDFIFKDAVNDIQNKVNECDDILVYGYCKGYRYVNGELYPHKSLWGGIGHLGIMQSLILNSAFAKTIPFICVTSFTHEKFKNKMKEFFEKHGLEFKERMFQQNTSTNAYIYYRHGFSQELLRHGYTKFKTPERRSLTTAYITKKQLAEEFGFFRELNSIE